MRLQWIDGGFAVCRLRSLNGTRVDEGFWFLARTDAEISLVCREERIPEDAEAVEGGWRMFRVAGPLDFGLTGIMARLSGALAKAGVPIFAVSTYDTDYIMIKAEHIPEAVPALRAAGCVFAPEEE